MSGASTKEEVRKKIEETESLLEYLESLPPDRSLTKIKNMLKSRLETLREIDDTLRSR